MRIKGNVKTEDKTWKIEIENVSYTYPGSEKEAVMVYLSQLMRMRK